MQESVKKIVEQCAENSYAGTVNFGEVVGSLIEAGVHSYFADYRRGYITYYMPVGTVHHVTMHAPEVEIAQEFSLLALQEAIWKAQHDAVKYREFLKLSRAAGCVGYIVWITGKKLTYFGYHGEIHTEHFPAVTAAEEK